MTVPADDILDLLTAYALDALTPDEMAQVRALLEEQPDLRRIVADLRRAADQIPYGLDAVEPPPELRQRVLDHAVGRAPVAPRLAPSQPPRRRGWLFALGGLAAAALLAAGIAWSQVGELRTDLANTQQQLATAEAARQQMAEIVAQTQTLAELQGDVGQGTLLRTVDGAIVFAANLPPLEAERVYQLWLIEGENAPVSGGTFTVDEEGYGVLINETQPLSVDTFAVTNEPAPGSPGPTTPILISGTPTSS